METKKVRKHTCFQNGLGQDPLNPKNCNCRKYVTTTEAALLVKESEAQYVVTRYAEVSDACPVCDGQDILKNSCIRCEKTGKIIRKEPVYGEDIIVSVGIKQQKIIKKKTPRSPTIEQGHIYRALDDPGSSRSDNARARWDEVELLTLKERIKLLVVNYDLQLFEIAWRAWEADPSQPFPLELRTEPSNNKQSGTGRRYDYGRSV